MTARRKYRESNIPSLTRSVLLRHLLIPPVTALCVLVTSFIENGVQEGWSEYKDWRAVWTRPGDDRNDDFQLTVTESCYYFPVLGVMLLNVGVLYLLGVMGVNLPDGILNGVIFWPLLVFGYSFLVVNAIEMKEDALVKLARYLNSITEVFLLALLSGFSMAITWIGSL